MIPASLAVVLATRRPSDVRGDRALERGRRARGRGRAGDRRRARRHRRLARPFLINVPVGLAIIAGTGSSRAPLRGSGAAPQRHRHAAARRRDRRGGARDLPGPGMGLERRADRRHADRGRPAVAVALRRSAHHPTPAVETGLWRSRTFATANLASLLYGTALFPWMLVGVLFPVAVWGYSPLQAGLRSHRARSSRPSWRCGRGRSSRAAARGGDRRRRARARHGRAAVRRRAARAPRSSPSGCRSAC